MIVYIYYKYNNYLSILFKMYFKKALKVVSLGYQVGMLANTYYMYSTLQNIKEINTRYTEEVINLMKQNTALKNKKYKH